MPVKCTFFQNRNGNDGGLNWVSKRHGADCCGGCQQIARWRPRPVGAGASVPPWRRQQKLQAAKPVALRLRCIVFLLPIPLTRAPAAS